METGHLGHVGHGFHRRVEGEVPGLLHLAHVDVDVAETALLVRPPVLAVAEHRGEIAEGDDLVVLGAVLEGPRVVLERLGEAHVTELAPVQQEPDFPVHHVDDVG